MINLYGLFVYNSGVEQLIIYIILNNLVNPSRIIKIKYTKKYAGKETLVNL